MVVVLGHTVAGIGCTGNGGCGVAIRANHVTIAVAGVAHPVFHAVAAGQCSMSTLSGAPNACTCTHACRSPWCNLDVVQHACPHPCPPLVTVHTCSHASTKADSRASDTLVETNGIGASSVASFPGVLLPDEKVCTRQGLVGSGDFGWICYTTRGQRFALV